MKTSINPLFSDVTWGAGGSTAELTLDIAQQLRESGHVANMHMTCTNMEKDGDPKKAVHDALQTAKDKGIMNIVALRGDPAHGQEEWTAAEGGFTCALDLVEYIRENFGSDFGISVAGYPEGHPNAISLVEDPSTMSETEAARSSTDEEGKVYTCLDEDYKKEMDYLKKKVDAGAGEFFLLGSAEENELLYRGIYFSRPAFDLLMTFFYLLHRLYHHSNVFRHKGLWILCKGLQKVGYRLSYCSRSHVY